MKIYEKIAEQDVLKVLSDACFSIDSRDPCFRTIPNIAWLLHTSNYQVRKNMRKLVEQGFAKKVCVYVYDDYKDVGFPQTGYRLTLKGKSTEKYKEVEKYHREIFGEVAIMVMD